MKLCSPTCFLFFQYYFQQKKNHVFIEEDKPSEKVVTAEEELNRFDIDSIGLPRFVFINDKCGYLKVVNDGGELTRDVNQKKKSDVSYQPVDIYSATNVGESTSSITMYNIVDQLGECDFSYGSAVNNLKDRDIFSDQMNRNRFDPISALRD